MANKRTITPTQPDDARAQRSIEALRAALLDLIERKPFEQITIRDITDAADLSYPTFFRRFASKEALLEDIAAAEVGRVLHLGEQAFEQRERPDSGAALCAYVQEHRRLWTVLLTGGAASAMRREFTRISREIAQSRARANPWIPIDLASAYTTSGIFEILTWWMQQPEDYPIENVIQYFDALIVDVLGRPRNIEIKPGAVKPTKRRPA